MHLIHLHTKTQSDFTEYRATVAAAAAAAVRRSTEKKRERDTHTHIYTRGIIFVSLLLSDDKTVLIDVMQNTFLAAAGPVVDPRRARRKIRGIFLFPDDLPTAHVRVRVFINESVLLVQ